MSSGQTWSQFPATYREIEARTVARWLGAGESGSVIGITGVGRTTFLEFLAYRLDALQQYLPQHLRHVILIPVDLNNLPDEHLSTFYRILLRSFYEQQERFKPSMQQAIHELYRKVEAAADPFLSQSALRELLTLCRDQELRVVLVMNRFDSFCETATTQMMATLRGLRDSFRGTLSYIVGMTREIVYLSEVESIKPLQGILDTHICWVGPLAEADARHMIERQTRHLHEPIPEVTVAKLWQLSGGYPSLLRVLCDWWLNEGQNTPVALWAASVLAQQNCQHRLRNIWQRLTDEEQFVLAELSAGPGKQEGKRGKQRWEQAQVVVLEHLATKGVCQEKEGEWLVVGELMGEYIQQVAAQSRGRVHLDAHTGEIYQGRTRLDGLQPLHHALLKFFVTRPHERHTHSDLIEAIWPEEVHKEGVSTEALYQVIRGIRKAIEADTSKPRYLINWRGAFEGGYQFYPEGRPR